MKKAHGGAGRNQGRKRKNPSGPRVKSSATLDPDMAKALAGKNTSEHIDAGLRIVIGAMDNPGMLAYNAISEAITMLELKRDSGADFTDPEQRLLETLYEFWERLRGETMFENKELYPLS